jgi:glutaredoxin
MDPVKPLPLRVCPRHGLVAGLDGRCVICHRDDAGGEAGDGGRRVVSVLLLAGALLGCVMIWKGVRGHNPPAAVEAAPAVPVQAPPAAPVPDEDPRARSAEQVFGAARAAADRDRQRDIEAEMHRVPIRMFMNATCELCIDARGWLKQTGLTYSEVDVGTDPEGLAVLRKLTPSAAVPTFEIDGEVLVGFGQASVLGAVRRAAEKRLR